MKSSQSLHASIALITIAMAACAPAAQSNDKAAAVVTPAVEAEQLDRSREVAMPTPPGSMTPASAPPNEPEIVVHKSPACGCCGGWVDHLRAEGFVVQVRDSDDLEPLKLQLGVPADKRSCHTAEVGGYFVEGHVPAADIKRLLAERPEARGLALPGMPIGSPGMEVPDGRIQPYTVELVGGQGGTQAYSEHAGSGG